MTQQHVLEIVEAVGDKAASVKQGIDPKSVHAKTLLPLAECVEALADVVKGLITVPKTEAKPQTEAKPRSKKKVVKKK